MAFNSGYSMRKKAVTPPSDLYIETGKITTPQRAITLGARQLEQ